MIAEALERILELPALKVTEPVKKLTMAEKPNIDLLIDDQRIIFDEVMAMVLEKEPGIYVIKGYAGTGKSFLTAMLLEQILSTMNVFVATTAPTNKAVKVLRKMSKFGPQVTNLAFNTIHSLLGLREKIDGYGRQTFVKMREEDVKVGSYNVIFIDESSMLNDELFQALLRYVVMYNLKLIFIGDPVQIPPVGGDDFILFKEEGVSKYKASVGELTKVLRQAADNPIIQLTMKIRGAIGRDIVIPVREDAYDEATMDGVYFMGAEDRDAFYQIIKTYFTSENFKQDADFVKVIAWTNKTVDAFNRLIRKNIYGEGIPKLCVGEKLLADEPIIDTEDTIIFNTNDEFEVESFQVNRGQFRGVEFGYYEAIVYNEDRGSQMIKILHEDSQEDYELVLKHYEGEAKSKKQGTWEAAQAWGNFFSCKRIFANVKYNYALTAHKAQGSTYDNVIVVESDIDNNRRVTERNRIKYTAFTRPKHKLFIAK